jgi:hypothetical protein
VGFIEDKIEHIASAVSLEGERTRIAMAAGLAETQRGLRIDGALARPFVPNAININGGGRLVGWSARAVGGAATVTFHDGRGTDGDVIATVGLAGDGSSSQQWTGPQGVSFAEALFVEVTGTVVGASWVGAVD